MGNGSPAVKRRLPSGKGAVLTLRTERQELGKAAGQTSPTQARQRAILSPFLLIHPPEILRACSGPGGDTGTDTLTVAPVFQDSGRQAWPGVGGGREGGCVVVGGWGGTQLCDRTLGSGRRKGCLAETWGSR